MGLIPVDVAMWFDEISIVALTMVAFLLGGSLTRENLVRHGRAILTISISIVVSTLVSRVCWIDRNWRTFLGWRWRWRQLLRLRLRPP